MSDPTHYDADTTAGAWTTAKQKGPVIVTFDPVYRCKSWIQTMTQRAGSFTPLAIDTAGGTGLGGFLTEETKPRYVDGDIIEWERIYWEVPPDREDSEAFVYNQQITIGLSVNEVPVPLPSIVKYSYFRTTNPGAITLEPAYKVGLAENDGTTVIWSVGTPPSGSTRLAEDESISRWKGDIWEKKRRTIKNAHLLSV
jgi:hypothetical protein